MDLLLVIDLQKDFINDNTKQLANKIDNLINSGKYSSIVFTRFINSEDSFWVKKLNYKGCITKEGQEIVVDTHNSRVVDKNTYSSFTNQIKEYINDNSINNIYLCGIDTESCILKTALDLFEKGYNVYVLKDYCASTLGELRHNNAIEILKRNIGEKYII